ncbi:MAG: S8 family serine peptidase, partial [Candidatus Pacearchaeota archaeon]|nr:S8 family serine peptidase [Candidatus Pacearchaeota archaeon]
MNKKFVFVAILVFVLIGSIGIIMARENENIKMKVEKAVVDEISEKGKARVIVVMKDYVKINKKNKETRERAINEIGNEKIKHKFDSLNAFSAFLNEEDIEKFANNENVEKIYFDRPVKVFLQDSVPLINASLAWRLREKGLNLTGKEQTVCIIDTGVNYSHINLGRCFGNTCKIINGYDFVNNDNDPKDDHGHGTHVTGIVAANGSLNGVAPEAKIVAIKALDSSGNGYISDVIKGIEWCTNNASLFNISVISMSCLLYTSPS